MTEDEVKKRTTEQNPSQYEIPDEIFVKLVVIWKMLQIHIIFNVSIHEFYFLAPVACRTLHTYHFLYSQ